MDFQDTTKLVSYKPTIIPEHIAKLYASNQYPGISGRTDVIELKNNYHGNLFMLSYISIYWYSLFRSENFQKHKNANLMFNPKSSISVRYVNGEEWFIWLEDVKFYRLFPFPKYNAIEKFFLEKSKETTEDAFGDSNSRADFLFKVEGTMYADRITGESLFYITNNDEEVKNLQSQGQLSFTINKLYVRAGFAIAKIDDDYVKDDIYFRIPQYFLNISLREFKINNIKFHSSNETSETYKKKEQIIQNFVQQKINGNLKELVERFKSYIFIETAPKIVRAKTKMKVIEALFSWFQFSWKFSV